MNVNIFDLSTFPERKFIETGHHGRTLNWTDKSEEELHKKNLSVFSSKYWKYANIPIEYRHNSNGFRCNQDLDDIDWENTSVVIGCSYVYGQGIENENTISQILTNTYGEAFVNAGVPGASNRMIHNNAITFMKHYNPKKIIILWSYPTRHTWLKLDNYGDGDVWDAINILPGYNTADRKKRIVHDHVPSAFYNIECHNTIHEWMTAIDVHTLLGNKQYHASDKYAGRHADANWIKPKDMTLYELQDWYECLDNEVTLEDLQKPEIYELLNKLYGRDLHYNSKEKSVTLGHFGEQMNRDIADLIYRENFK